MQDRYAERQYQSHVMPQRQPTDRHRPPGLKPKSLDELPNIGNKIAMSNQHPSRLPSSPRRVLQIGNIIRPDTSEIPVSRVIGAIGLPRVWFADALEVPVG
nr:hypothetical protein [Kribbella qitaiheensis]